MRPWWVLLITGCGFQLTAGSSVEQDDARSGSDAAEVDATVVDARIPIDAPIDAAPWTNALCPSSYTVAIANSDSRYRFDRVGAGARSQAADCLDDGEGTHLVNFETTTELHAIRNAANQFVWPTPTGTVGEFVWVGGAQPQSQTLEGNWIDVFGQPLVTSWTTDEPNDWVVTEDVEDSEENLLILWIGRDNLADMGDVYNLGVICECDGKEPVAAFTQAYTAASDP